MKAVFLFFIAIFIFIGVLVSLSLNSPKLDASTEEKMQASLEKMKNSLDDDEREKVADALQVLIFSSLDFNDLLSGKADPKSMTTNALKEHNGKNARQLIEAAELVKVERKNEQRKQAIEEIKDIEQKLRSLADARITLSKVEVIKSKFYIKKGIYSSDYPVIEITIKNSTDKPISRIYFDGTVASPGRSVPWVKDDFNYDIKGGLEPNETANWSLSPNRFSDWGSTNIPKDAILTVKVVKIDDAEGKEIASLDEDNKDTLERLKKLKEFVK